uniref:Cyclin C-terminal domain-containing protein n=1 Tax=Corethron hystrix TaxID=216773 RepID=A0A7S1BIP4_9STRA
MKVSDPVVKVSVSSMVQLSNDNFDANDIIEMELDILQTLSWNIHPPTPITFIHYIFRLHPEWENHSHQLKSILIRRSKIFVEISTCSYHLIEEKPSIIAFASILIALDETKLTNTSPIASSAEHEQFLQNVYNITLIHHNSEDLRRVKFVLTSIFQISQKQKIKMMKSTSFSYTSEKINNQEVPVSPTSVYQVHQQYFGRRIGNIGTMKKPMTDTNDVSGYISSTSGEEE